MKKQTTRKKICQDQKNGEKYAVCHVAISMDH